MFCAAPTITASMRGVVPIRAVMGAKKAGKRLSEKNMAPVTRRVTGVIRAATPQPNFCQKIGRRMCESCLRLDMRFRKDNC